MTSIMFHSIMQKKNEALVRGKNIHQLINEAHDIFDQTSIFDIIENDRPTAIELLNEAYDNPSHEKVDRYLKVIERLRHYVD